jgi:glycosyltransferase involved in cell wall biosynthesis
MGIEWFEELLADAMKGEEMKPKISVIIPVYNAEKTLQKALDSVPVGDNITAIVIDDGSTDHSWDIIRKWLSERHEEGLETIVHHSKKNCGVAHAMNLGFSIADGDYIVSLSSDDYYLTDFKPFYRYLDGTNDLVYFDLEINDGTVWHLDEKNKDMFVGAVKFIRREFLGDTRIPDLKWHEDIPFSQALQAKDPWEAYTGIVLKHYNWPREGSLSWQANHAGN